MAKGHETGNLEGKLTTEFSVQCLKCPPGYQLLNPIFFNLFNQKALFKQTFFYIVHYTKILCACER